MISQLAHLSIGTESETEELIAVIMLLPRLTNSQHHDGLLVKSLVLVTKETLLILSERLKGSEVPLVTLLSMLVDTSEEKGTI